MGSCTLLIFIDKPYYRKKTMKMNYSISRRGFIRFSLVGGAALSINPFGILKALAKTPSQPGYNLEQLISKNSMTWLDSSPSAMSPELASLYQNGNFVQVGGSVYNMDNMVLDANDEAQIGVDSNLNNSTVRLVRDSHVPSSEAGNYLNAVFSDSIPSALNWQLLAVSDNIVPLNPALYDNIFGTDPAPVELSGEIYSALYRGLDGPGAASGTTRNLDEQVDRYRTLITIDYMYDDNGTMTPDSFQFYAPHDVVKHLMEWEEPMPYFPNGVTLDPLHNQFVPFFTHLQELLQSPQLGNDLKDDLSRLINRMTPSPCPDPNPAYDDLALLDGISQGDVTVHDNMYPTLVAIDQQDLTTAAGKMAAQYAGDKHVNFQNRRFVKKAGSRLYKPSGVTDISYTPPMDDATLPTSMQGINNQNNLGWMHSYLVQCDANNRPELSFSGMSDNLQPSWMSEATGNPNEYMVHVLLQTGDQQSLDNLTINFQQVPMGIKDGRQSPNLPTSPLVVHSNYPEPFNSRTSIEYEMKSPGQLNIAIYNILGQEIVNLYNGNHQAGDNFHKTWNSLTHL